MQDYDDMRRRAAQQASYGNYWAGKCVGLIDAVRELETRLIATQEANISARETIDDLQQDLIRLESELSSELL